jgi:hypothetical protein
MLNEPGNKPKTSKYQLIASMTPDELLSEGYASYDDFYDPQEQEWKKAVEEMERIASEHELNGDKSKEF